MLQVGFLWLIFVLFPFRRQCIEVSSKMGSFRRAHLLNLIYPQDNIPSDPMNTIKNDGLVPYELGWKWQGNLADQLINAQSAQDRRFVGTLLMLQHSSVYTLGTSTTANSGPFIPSRDKKANNGNIDLSSCRDLEYTTIKVDRAGQATYHGPGQVVLYPIIDLNFFEKDINTYLRNLEQIVINCLRKFGIQGERVEGYTGVWVGRYKVAAIGVKIRRWVTLHGVSVNVHPDMRYFQNIVPCGISEKDTGRSVGCMQQFNSAVTMAAVAKELMLCFEEVFGVALESAVDCRQFRINDVDDYISNNLSNI